MASRIAYALLWLLVVEPASPFHEAVGRAGSRGFQRPTPVVASRRAWPPPTSATQSHDSNEASAAVDEASAAFVKKRVATGDDAFADTTWSVLIQVAEGGSTIFTVQMLEGHQCRFSDTDEYGSWECERDWVIFEKPKGLFGLTLYLSARLAPPTGDASRWKLVEGIVQSANTTEAAEAKEGDESPTLEFKQIGTFGANEYEESLLAGLNRFRDDEQSEAAE